MGIIFNSHSASFLLNISGLPFISIECLVIFGREREREQKIIEKAKKKIRKKEAHRKREK